MMMEQATSNHNKQETHVFEDNESQSSTENGGQQKDVVAVVGQKETKAVSKTRFLVFGVMVAGMVAVALTVYFLTRRNETTKFEQQFAEDAHKVLQSIGTTLDFTLGGIDAFAIAMVSHARAANQTWPFVTLPDFAIRAHKTLAQTNAILLNLHMLVENQTQREVWEKEFTANEGPKWVTEVMEMQEREGLFQDAIDKFNVTLEDTLAGAVDYIHDINVERVVYDGPYLPAWQRYPMVSPGVYPPYSWDLKSESDIRAVMSLYATQKVTITEAYMIAYPNQTELIAENEVFADFLDAYLTTGEDAMEPVSDIWYPVLKDSADYINGDRDSYKPRGDNLGGVVSISLYWREFIKGILPASSGGMLAVFETGCSPTFTYQINGPNVEFIGAGDHHEARFSQLEQSGFLADLSRDFSVLQSGSYSGVPLNEEFCPFQIRLYPSSNMEEAFRTNGPLVFAFTAVLVFVVTSASFFIHDVVVERRNKVVMKTAVKSDRIVSSLFPATVKERLYEENSTGADAQEETLDMDSSRRQFLASKATGQSSMPIASSYAETTVLFADIAGFTAWSSSRDPPEVFVLLETLYGSFDRSAKKLGVFKVETIGDCYMAVTGLPQPRKNHAVVMARFAAEIRDSMSELTHQLEATLQGAQRLRIRTGLHSGRVTAGVLRGEKSRFQLFGDTVNTSARMESNGLPNKIHASQATADKLIQAGKANWLTRRDELIEAKGKGKMQTYWVEPMQYSGSTTASSDAEYFFSDFQQRNGDHGAVQNIPVHNMAISAVSAEQQRSTMLDRVCTIMEEQLTLLSAKGIVDMPEKVEKLDYLRLHAEDDSQGIRADISDCISFETASGTLHRDAVRNSLPTVVVDELQNCVLAIAHTCRDTNTFHDLAQACHCVSATNRMLEEITPRLNPVTSATGLADPPPWQHGFRLAAARVASDPVVRLALLFAALGSCADHPGVPNELLIKEQSSLAVCYKGKNVAQRNSLDVTWRTFMDDSYRNLHNHMFAGSSKRLDLFRQLMIRAFIAMDVADPNLNRTRQERWERTFLADDKDWNLSIEQDERLTLLLDYLVQGAYVSDAMSEWKIYQMSSAQRYQEAADAYASVHGGDRNPSDWWFEQELSAFDDVIVPLAQRLDNSNVFAAKGNEWRANANNNRLEWGETGKSLIQRWEAEFQQRMVQSETKSGAASHRVQNVVA